MSAREATLFLTAGILLVAGVAKKPCQYRWLFFPAILAASLPLYYSKDLPPEPVSILLLFASDYILLTEVQQEMRAKDQKEAITNESLWARIKWSLRLLVNMRGIGWKHEPLRSLPPRPRLSRIQFILSRTFWFITYLLLFDIGLQQVKLNPAFRQDTSSLGSSEWGWVWRFWTMIQLAGTADSMLAIVLNVLPALVCVALGVSEPEEWPHLFGSIILVPTVHRVWGYSWHQLLRRPFLSHGKFIAHRILRIRPGSRASQFTQIMVSFFISGAMHTHTLSSSGAIKFFLAQGSYIVVEDLVIKFFSGTVVATWGRFWKVVGHLWLWAFFVQTLPLFFDSLVETGSFEELVDVPDLGLVRWLISRVPTTHVFYKEML